MKGIVRSAFWALAAAGTSEALTDRLNGDRMTIRDLRTNPVTQLRKRDDVDPSTLYVARNFSTPIDHFHNDSSYAPHSDDRFNVRYWADTSYYAPGGPVIILQSGETDATARLPYLQKGILHDLIKATHGIGVIYEHRYYGESIPTPDLSTENLRFLTTAQALADQAYFAQNIVFEGLEHVDLTSATTAYMGYGGSYAGAFNALLRIIYPDVFWGTISSSGVTKAIYDYWEYYSPIAEYAPKSCIAAQRTLTHIVDNILIGVNETDWTYKLKDAFGLENVTHSNDFANILAGGISNWQSLNWDPDVSIPEFYNYCANISDTEVLYPATEPLRSVASSIISKAGYNANSTLTAQMLNYIGYVNLTSVTACVGESQDACFSNNNASFYEMDDISQTWRAWPYQYCTQWAYLQTGSGVPEGEEPLISRTLDLPYESLVCKYAFNITTPPDTEAINKYGGYNVSYPRLALIDGEIDPWRPATPHAFKQGARDRVSTASEPFILIANAEHHYDENGRFPNETTPELPPLSVKETQEMEVMFVQEWMQEWELRCLILGGCS